MNSIQITKASGERAPFSGKKLEESLFRAGAGPDLIANIVSQISNELYEGIKTREIYKRAFQILRKASYKLAAKYKLKKAILELGPSGYPFEEYVGHLFRYQGMNVETGVMLDGKCVKHEIDVRAKNHVLQYLCECKHHRTPGHKSDVKTALYVHARMEDVIGVLKKKHKDKMAYQGWLITNTRFTVDAQEYARCANLSLLSWDYPAKGSLRERIELSGLYPITCLCTLTKSEKASLMEKEIVLCKQLIDDPTLLPTTDQRRISKVIKECKELVYM